MRLWRCEWTNATAGGESCALSGAQSSCKRHLPWWSSALGFLIQLIKLATDYRIAQLEWMPGGGVLCGGDPTLTLMQGGHTTDIHK